jgi:shikimate dehydrogenase
VANRFLCVWASVEVERVFGDITMEKIKFGVIGDPIAQSKSPLMMNAAFEKIGYPGVYEKYHVKPDELADAIKQFRAQSFRGLNVTIPHKVAIMAHLDEIDEDARHIGAVNTVVNDNGKLIGYNTDGIGYVRSLLEETGFSPEGKRILFLGAGGAARGVIYAMLKQKPSFVGITNRTLEKAEELANSLQSFGTVQALSESAYRNERWDLIVNTTSVGMFPDVDATPFDANLVQSNMLVSDLIYNPRETKLLLEAKTRGARIHNGFGMFIYQGAYAFEYWTGLQAPVEEMRNVIEAAL